MEISEPWRQIDRRLAGNILICVDPLLAHTLSERNMWVYLHTTSGLCCSGPSVCVRARVQCTMVGGSPSLCLLADRPLALGPVKVLLSAVKLCTAEEGILYPSNGLLTHITCPSGFL